MTFSSGSFQSGRKQLRPALQQIAPAGSAPMVAPNPIPAPTFASSLEHIVPIANTEEAALEAVATVGALFRYRYLVCFISLA